MTAKLRHRFWLAILLVVGCADPKAPPQEARPSVAASLQAGRTEGFEQALLPRTFSFPRDHGPHPSFKTEWWYWTGHLEDRDRRRFGYQLTFFRSGLEPPEPAGATAAGAKRSAWNTRQLYMAHFALTDVDGQAFYAFERFGRGAVGLAGARATPFRVWLDDWSASAAASGTEVRLSARDRTGDTEVRLELELEPGKRPVLHGERGLSRKSPRPGAASYYYSLSRQPTAGRLEIGDRAFEVTGSSWLDREWSTSLLGEDEVGWDWLGAQLDDGRELMFFRLRKRDGSAAWTAGTLIEVDGSSRGLRTGSARVRATDDWASGATGVSYPIGLRVDLPEEPMSLEVAALVADQELRESYVYWEGATRVSGDLDGEPVTGRGYLELTGYGPSPRPDDPNAPAPR